MDMPAIVLDGFRGTARYFQALNLDDVREIVSRIDRANRPAYGASVAQCVLETISNHREIAFRKPVVVQQQRSQCRKRVRAVQIVGVGNREGAAHFGFRGEQRVRCPPGLRAACVYRASDRNIVYALDGICNLHAIGKSSTDAKLKLIQRVAPNDEHDLLEPASLGVE